MLQNFTKIFWDDLTCIVSLPKLIRTVTSVILGLVIGDRKVSFVAADGYFSTCPCK